MNHESHTSIFKQIITVPFIVRLYFILLILFQILDITQYQWSMIHLTSNFRTTIQSYEVWRYFINFVYEPEIITCGIILVHFICFLPRFERVNGSIITLYQIITAGYLVQFLVLSYETFIYILNINGFTQKWNITYQVGAAGLWINLYLKYLYFNYQQCRKNCGLKSFLIYTYLIALIILCSFLVQQARIDMIAGFILGVIQCVIFKGGIIFYTPDTYTEKQKLANYCKASSIPCCFWSPLNQQRIKTNKLLVVEARQFYYIKNNFQQGKQSIDYSQHQQQLETQRVGFSRNRFEITDRDAADSKGEKWQKQEAIQDY